MQTYPLKSIDMTEAMQKQFLLIDCITQEFAGAEILNRGDLGVVMGLNQPLMTQRIEKVLAQFFGAEAAMLIRGAGTMALRESLYQCTKENKYVLVHDAPIYPTTQVSFDMMGIEAIKVDFNNLLHLQQFLQKNPQIGTVLIQYTRQKPDDSYEIEAVISTIKKIDAKIKIITDDNYAALKVSKIGVEMGATFSCFSSFKLLGPEGIGCIIGDKSLIVRMRQDAYSGGLQVQGHEAIDVLRGMIYAPVSFAISAEQTTEIVKTIQKKQYPEIKDVFIANAQSRVVIVEFMQPIAELVLKMAQQLGAAPYPIGAESQYEFVPMFYRVSGTFLTDNPQRSTTMIRINPMRSGAPTVLRILEQALDKVREKKIDIEEEEEQEWINRSNFTKN